MNKKDFETGMYVVLRDGNVCIVQYAHRLIIDIHSGFYCNLNSYNEKLNHYNNYGLDIVKVYKDYTMEELLWERNELLLTQEEKDYLKAILKPLTCKVSYVMRKDWICIKLNDLSEYISLPLTSNMTLKFKGLKKDKKYTLEELGLDGK